ncbi:hypothetical protein IWQ60_002503 [Tieghemiomyces parasiticus]|uniref:Chromatin modification-related protein EAF7 n=1 Tax=Tieghemiomyces parasiticus TaxID=78921 RepID=A0A9W8AC23_9FUNG|nr:hypothetical protein IWQ60_002503 [Tieghemiomyces parasiticus]
MYGAVTDTVHWTPQMEIALFQAMVGRRPVGIHKHFRMIAIYDQFLHSGLQPCTTQDIWEKLDELFNLPELDAGELASDDDDSNEASIARDPEVIRDDGGSDPVSGSRRRPPGPHHPSFWKYTSDFELPWDEYEPLIVEHGRCHEETSTEATPASTPMIYTPTSRSLRTRRSSPALSAGSSRAVSPEGDREVHVAKKTRRATSGTRKDVPALADVKPSTPLTRRKTGRNTLPSPTAKSSPAVGTRRTARKN